MSTKFQRALSRCLNEVAKASRYRQIEIELARANTPMDGKFFHLVYLAVSDGSRGHLAKVLEDNRQAASFWYLYAGRQQDIDAFLTQSGTDLVRLRRIAGNIKHIRDRTLFHIDARSVIDPRDVYDKAGLTYADVDFALHQLNGILQHLHVLEHGHGLDLMRFDSTEVGQIVALARDARA